MSKVSSRILHAVLVTVLACCIVFGLAIYFFGIYNLWAPRVDTLSPVTPIPSETSNIVTIATSVDNTGVVMSSDAINCTMEYLPVCGSDGQTYSNTCVANSKGVTTLTEGECLQNPVSSDTLESTETVVMNDVDHNNPPTLPMPAKDNNIKVCTQEYAPICGVDNKTYSNTCMAGDTAIAHIGECSGTEKKIYDDVSYQLYASQNFGYDFAMPKYSYYASAGSNDGANHTMAIAITASGTTDFATAPVQVWFYKKTPANPPSTQFIKIENGILYIKNNDTTGSAKIEKIIEVVLESVK